MAPIKFEENIKDKLEKRTISPSEDSWDKLSNKLDEHEDKSNGKIVWWIGIAASLVGVFLVTTLFFNQSEDETVLPVLVDSPIEKTLNQQEEKEPLNNVLVESEEPFLKETITLNKKVENHIVNRAKVRKTIDKSNNEVVDATIEEDKIQNQNLIHSNTIIAEENKQEITAQILDIEKDKNLVTDSEIELLLENAQKDIALKQNKKEQSKTVNANSLLQDVETDLDVSFRDKIFKSIESGYNTVRTAVVERNY